MKLEFDAALCRGHGRCYTLAEDLLTEDDEGYVTARGQVVDVPPDQVDDARNGLVLGYTRAGVEEVQVARAVRRDGLVDAVGVLGMHDEQTVEAADLTHRGLELSVIERRELVDARVQQEALVAEHAGLVEWAQVGDVARDRAAPESDVDVRLGLGGFAFEPERRHVAGRRDAVERHVDDRGDTAAGRCLGR